jgi:hypothetical protein
MRLARILHMSARSWYTIYPIVIAPLPLPMVSIQSPINGVANYKAYIDSIMAAVKKYSNTNGIFVIG